MKVNMLTSDRCNYNRTHKEHSTLNPFLRGVSGNIYLDSLLTDRA